jgi:hypothetical protein
VAAILVVPLEGRQPEGRSSRGHNLLVPRGRKRKEPDDRLEPYRKVRKPVPPPSRVLPDRRRKTREEIAEREANEAEDEARGGREP